MVRIGRRGVLLGGMAGLVGACQGATERPGPVTSSPGATGSRPSDATTSAGAGELLLIYVWAWNCQFCPAFDEQHMTPFERSPEGARVPLRRVDVPHFRAIWRARGYWPEDLEWVRAHFAAQNAPNGTPHTILIRGQTILERRFGTAGWRDVVHPRLRQEISFA